MKLVIIFGPQAVGKMTVGQQLAEITGLKLFHNHMTIDLVSNFFDYSSQSGKRLVNLFRREIFEEVANSELEGLIFTCVWGLDIPSDWDYIKEISGIFESKGGTVYLVELESSLEERLIRNKSDNRLLHKPTKRNIERSERDLIRTYEDHRLNTNPGEITSKNYMKINNSDIDAETVAIMIKEKFQFI